MKAEWSTDPSEFTNRSVPVQPERFDDVIDAVEDLPVELKDVVNAVYWERLSAPKAIEALGVSATTFYRRLAEAKLRLQDVLRTDLSGDPERGLVEEVEMLVSPEAG